MANEYLGVVTLVGQQKIAGSIGGTPLNLTTVRVGDGNGAPINPVSAMTDLVRRVGSPYPIVSSARDANNPQMWRITALIPEAEGPFDIREIAVFDNAGDMIAIARHTFVAKITPAQGAAVAITTDIVFPVSDTAQVAVTLSADVAVDIGEMLRAPFLVVESATVTAPPANPAPGRTHVVPTGATGAWAGFAGYLAQWNGTAWVMVNPPVGHQVVVQDKAADTGLRYLSRTATGWLPWLPLYMPSTPLLPATVLDASFHGKTYVLDLGVFQTPVFPDPATVPEGAWCIVEVIGSPSGTQTAKFSATGGATFSYRGVAAANFYLIGRGEVFRVRRDGAGYKLHCLGSPLSAGATLGSSSTSLGIQPLGAAWVRPVSCRDGADNIALFGGVAANNAAANDKIIAPVTGLYMIRLQGEFIAATGSTAGGQAGVMNGNPATTAAVSSNFWVLNPIGLWTSGDDYRFPTTVRFAQAGAEFWPAFLSTSSLNYYPQSTVLSVSLVSR